MATTIDHPLTTAWLEVATADYLAIQNNGTNPILLFWKATAPSPTDRGFVIPVGGGVDMTSFGSGPVYAKVLTKDGISSVTVNE